MPGQINMLKTLRWHLRKAAELADRLGGVDVHMDLLDLLDDVQSEIDSINKNMEISDAS